MDYFVNNPNCRKGSEIDVGEGGFLKHKARPGIVENEKSILRGKLYDAVGYDWEFRSLKTRYKEQGGPIVRPTKSGSPLGLSMREKKRIGSTL